MIGMITDINGKDRLVQKTFANHLNEQLGWESVYAWNDGTFGPGGRPVLTRDLLPRLMSGEIAV